MSYYRGDYYRGDYYRGDSLFSKAFGVVKGVASAAVRTFAPGYVGAALDATIGGHSSGAAPAPQFSISPGGQQIPNISQLRPGTSVAIPQSGGTVVGVSPLGTIGVREGAPDKGYHWSARSQKWVRNRHMNVGNARALTRSLRRAHGFARLARHVMSFEITGRRTGRGHFKAKRRVR
jgi:hypothetical protein